MIDGVILDLDGTVYEGDREVPGASEFVGELAASGRQYLFVTNRANRTPEVVAEQLRGYGIACTTDHVLTAAQATAVFLGSGSAYVIGEEALEIALREVGMTVTDEGADYVVVGFDRWFDYEKLRRACFLIGEGATFVATNPDRALRTELGLLPGTGAIVAAVEAGTNVAPVVVGKPERRIIDMGLARLGLAPERVLVVGDNLLTDIPAGARAGTHTALLLTGVSRREEVGEAEFEPTWVVEDYAALGQVVFGDR